MRQIDAGSVQPFGGGNQMNEAKKKALVTMAEFFNKIVQKYKKAIEELKFKGGSL